jgi:poly-gamma-glutamate capsule biosynthesis protein CapA/YwtB (metallophosphatase superfamily)/outer membrane protein assembly factor BamB
MQRLLPLVALLSLWGAAACGSTSTIEITPEPTATSALVLAGDATPTHVPEATLPPSPTPSATATPTARPSSTPVPTPTPTVTPTMTLPPILTPVDGEPLPLALRWRFDANGHLTSSRTGRLGGQQAVLLSSLGRTLYALSDGGKLLWQARTSGPAYSLAILDEGLVAAGDDAGYITAFNAHGQRLWQYNLGSRVTALESNGDGLLAGGWDEHLTLLSAKGELRWRAALSGPLSCIAALPQLAAAATLHGDIQAFDANGTEVWLFKANAPVTNLGILNASQGPLILASVQDGRLLALDLNGSLRWQRSLGSETQGSPVWHVADVTGDTLPEIVVGTGGTLPIVALLSTSGEILWRITLPSEVAAVTTVDLEDDGAVEIIAGLSSGQVRVYDGSGQLCGSAHAGLSVSSMEATGVNSVVILADIVAWQLVSGSGTKGGPWLPAPPTVPAPLEPRLAGTEQTDGDAVLVFLGDVCLGRTMETLLARYGPAYPWEGLKPLLQNADLAVANLESALTTQGKLLNKPYLIRAHPLWGQALAQGGLDLVTLANNHVFDYGSAGLDETMATLNALDIAFVGAGSSEEQARRAAVFTLNGVRVAVLAYAAARWNGSADIPATDRIAWAEPALVQADVRAARDNADVVIVLLHAGTEYAAQPSSDQVAVAHAAIEAGADLVVGHHPHVTQTVERIGQGLVVYSLGDTLFDIPRSAAMQGDLLRVYVSKQGLTRAELWPFWIENSIRPRLLANSQGEPRVEVVYP